MTDLRYTSTEFLPVYPTNSLSNARQISFQVGAFTGAGALKLQDAFIYLKVKLTKDDGTTNVPDGKSVAPVNVIAHSVFSSCSTYLNDQLINTSNDMYNYKAYLLTHLSYGMDPKFSYLQGAGYYGDVANQFDNADVNMNSGFLQRLGLFADDPFARKYHGEEVQFATRLFTDLVTTDAPIPPGNL
jgi:hypothetical protein